ncbi:hypothetical protein J6590_091197, partial [Homalodisca vitripennis]
ETSDTFYSSGYPGLIYGNFTHLLQLCISRGCLGDSSSNTFYSYGYPRVFWETPLQTPSTALDIPGLSTETSHTFYSSGYPGVVYGNFRHLLELWISRGCLRKLHTPSTALDIPGLSTETSDTFYSSGYPRVVYGNFTHLLQFGYGYPGVVWETPPQTPSTAMDIPGLSRETSDTFYSSGYPRVVYGNFTHLLQLGYGYPGVVWETPLQTPSTAMDIPGLSRETSDTFYSSGYPGVVYGNFRHLLQLWISQGCLRKLHTPSTARVGWSAVVKPGQH